MNYTNHIRTLAKLTGALLFIASMLICMSSSYAAGRKAQIRWTALSIEMAGDVDRDGLINVHPAYTDGNGALVKTDLTQDPYLMWINDDDDFSSTETKGHDIPNSYDTGFLGIPGFFGLGDYDNNDSGIDGTRDLVDFFPVAINLHHMLQSFDTSPSRAARRSSTRFASDNYEFLLRQEDEAVNVVFTKMTMSEANAYLIDTRIADNRKEELLGDWHEIFGNDLNDILTEKATTEGLKIPNEFIQHVKDTADSGVILLEGVAATNKPLQLILKNKITDKEIPLGQVSLSVHSVTEFYRYVNIRGSENRPPTNTAANVIEPVAVKDADTNGKHMIAMHGYNVSDESAQGWAAEAFKRTWQAGSNAMFTFISWTGNQTQGAFGTPNYWTNVVNAFNSSETLAEVVNNLPGSEKHIMGHSLGNMVISNAIQNHNMLVNNYFMMDAAVALEGYDSRTITTASINRMRNPVWELYIDNSCVSQTEPCVSDPDKINERWLWSAEWHLLFETNDARRDITWRNVFADIFTKTNVKNYYSSTEEVLANGDGTLSSLDAITGDGGIGFKSWTIQEMGKGTTILAADLAELYNGDELDIYGGWGLNMVDYATTQDFSFDYSVFEGMIDFVNDPLNFTQWPMTPDHAFQLTTAEVRQAPFFTRFNVELGHDALYGPKSNTLSDTIVDPLLPHLRGHAIPALSDATGRNSLPNQNNLDMSLIRNGWPIERGPDDSSNGIARWKHGDLKDVAYLYVYPLYIDFVRNEAGLNH